MRITTYSHDAGRAPFLRGPAKLSPTKWRHGVPQGQEPLQEPITLPGAQLLGADQHAKPHGCHGVPQGQEPLQEPITLPDAQLLGADQHAQPHGCHSVSQGQEPFYDPIALPGAQLLGADQHAKPHGCHGIPQRQKPLQESRRPYVQGPRILWRPINSQKLWC